METDQNKNNQSFIEILKEILLLIWPVVKEVMDLLKNQRAREIALELKKAKSVEEKREAAKKIADYLYRP